jgi:hypothetical protein
MILQLFNASFICTLMISFDSLFGVTLIYGMLVISTERRRVMLSILAMQPTTKYKTRAITKDVVVIKEHQGRANSNS